jgi:photosystem II stability/assembly factor-like uncharacterized protein
VLGRRRLTRLLRGTASVTLLWAVGTPALTRLELLFSSTRDGGATWSPTVTVTTLSDNAAINSEAVRFADAHHGWVSGQGLLTTLDGGQTWKGAGLKGFVGPAAPAGDSVWALQTPCGDSAGSCSPVLVQSHVGSATWEPAPQQPGLPAGSADLLRVSASEAFITDIPRQQLADPVLLKTINAGSTWQQLKNPCGPTTSESLASLDGVHAWIACGYGPSAGERRQERLCVR